MQDIDRLSRRVPVLCKVAPSVADVHLEDVHRAGGMMAILGELDRAGLLNRGLPTVHSKSLEDALDRWDIKRTRSESVRKFFMAAPGNVPTQVAFSQERRFEELDTDRAQGLHPRRRACLFEGRRSCGALGQYRARRLHREDRGRRCQHLEVRGARANFRKPGRRRSEAILGGKIKAGDVVVDPLRGTARRPRHAGDAVSDQLPQIEGPRQGVRADHRRPLLRRIIGTVDRARLAGSGRRRLIGLVEDGDRIEIDIPSRSISLLVDDATLARRREAMLARGRGCLEARKTKPQGVDGAESLCRADDKCSPRRSTDRPGIASG